MTGAAEEEGVVMILAAQEFLVVRDLDGQPDLVAGRAKLLRLHERLEEGLLVKVRLRFHELIVNPLQCRVGAVGEWIVNRLVDGIGGVAAAA